MITVAQSGKPYTLLSNTTTPTGNNNNRINSSPGVLVRDASSVTAIRLADGVMKAQLTPAAGALGSIGRNTERTESTFDVSLSLAKDFGITERVKLQLRGELYNAFNLTNFNAVDNGLSSPNFGRYISAFGPRRAQVAVRLTF